MGNHQTVEECITITNDCLNVGGFAFEKMAGKLNLIAAVGTLIMGVNNLSRDDPIMQKLEQLERKVDQLSDKMSWQFDDLKAFTVENYFYTEVAQTASTLTKFLADALKNPNDHSRGLFRDASLRTPPLHCAYKFISLFEQNETNPLIWAMKADRYKKAETFNKWRGIIDAVLGQFLFLETFVNAMFWDSNMYGPNELKDKIHGIHGRIDWLRANYKNTYWPGAVENIVNDVQTDGGIRSHDDKAIAIKERLMSILNDHIFYIIVYDDCGTWENHAFTGRGDQYMTSFRKGGCNVVIYRSYHFLNCENSAIDRIKRQTEECCDSRMIPDCRDLKNVPGKIWDKIEYCGFVGIIRKKFHVVVRSANSFRHEWGPGWWKTALSYGVSRGTGWFPDFPRQEDFILIAGFH